MNPKSFFHLLRTGRHPGRNDRNPHAGRPGHPTQPLGASPSVEELGPAEMKALRMAARTDGVEDLLDFVSRERPDWLPRLKRLLERRAGVPGAAIHQLQLELAAERLSSVSKLSELADQRRAALLLPMPPHIADAVLYSFADDLVFLSDDEVPPHLARAGYAFLDDLLPDDIAARFSGVEAIVAEAYIRRGAPLMRRSVVHLLQVLDNPNLQLFLHPMPHVPHHLELVPLNRECSFTEIL